MTSTAHPTDKDPNTSCIFCEIANKNISASIVHEDEDFVAFLDINPIRPGHVLIASRLHYAYFDDLPPEQAARIMQLGQRFSRAMKQIHGVERVGFVLTGTDIAHVHAHVVPLASATDITSTAYIAQKDLSFTPAPRASSEALAEQLARLKKALAGQDGHPA